MLPVTLWFVKGLAVVLGISHGYFLATVPTHWSEDSWEEEIPHPMGTALDASDESGMYRGCLSAFMYLLARLQHGWMLYGLGRVLAPLLTFLLAGLGWPPVIEDYAEVGQRGIFVWPFLLLGEVFLWVALGSMTGGYVGGRLLHKGFFTDRTK